MFEWQNTFVFCKTLFLFCKTHLCFQSVGPVCQKHFRKDTNYLKNEIGFSNIGDFKKNWNRAKTICLGRCLQRTPFFSFFRLNCRMYFLYWRAIIWVNWRWKNKFRNISNSQLIFFLNMLTYFYLVRRKILLLVKH